MKCRVVVTGFGVLSPIGSETEFTIALKNGQSGVDFIRQYCTEKEPVKIDGEVQDYCSEDFFSIRELKITDRFSQFAILATQMALEKAKLTDQAELLRCSEVYIGTGIGGIATYAQLYDQVVQSGRADVYGIPKIMNNAAAGLIATRFQVQGGNYSINTACSSGSNAIGLTYLSVKEGRSTTAICGGTEAPLGPKILRAWNSLQVLNNNYSTPQEACKPFRKGRNGFSIAEGAGVLILEEREQAIQRRAEISGEIIGFACNDRTKPFGCQFIICSGSTLGSGSPGR